MPKPFSSVALLMEAIRADLIAVIDQSEPLMREIGEDVQRIAKDKLGHYQGSVGPFNAWAQLSPVTRIERVRKGFTPNDPLLRTGRLRASIEFSAEARRTLIGVKSRMVSEGKHMVDIAEIAIKQEYGSGRTPPRPFLRAAIYQDREHIIKLIKKYLGNSLRARVGG